MLMKVLVPALAVPKKRVKPPGLVRFRAPGAFVKVLLPAEARWMKSTCPTLPWFGLSITKDELAPAEAALLKVAVPPTRWKDCVTAELLVIPVPPKFKLVLTGRVSEKALALAPKTIALTVTGLESETAGVLETSNVAVSRDEFGTVFGVQFVAVFQSPVAGLALHVALPARAPEGQNIRIRTRKVSKAKLANGV